VVVVVELEPLVLAPLLVVSMLTLTDSSAGHKMSKPSTSFS
jgi:hypothetical protein